MKTMTKLCSTALAAMATVALASAVGTQAASASPQPQSISLQERGPTFVASSPYSYPSAIVLPNGAKLKWLEPATKVVAIMDKYLGPPKYGTYTICPGAGVATIYNRVAEWGALSLVLTPVANSITGSYGFSNRPGVPLSVMELAEYYYNFGGWGEIEAIGGNEAPHIPPRGAVLFPVVKTTGGLTLGSLVDWPGHSSVSASMRLPSGAPLPSNGSNPTNAPFGIVTGMWNAGGNWGDC